MAQPFYARKTDLRIGTRKGETVYSAQPYYNGVISTVDVATQIAQEASLTKADVIGVLERLSYFCQSHLKLGYKVKLDGIGVLYNELITTNSVGTSKAVTSKLVKTVRPAFAPEYTIINGSFRYSLLPERVELVKVNFKGEVETDDALAGADSDTSSDDTDDSSSSSGGSSSNSGGSSSSGEGGELY